MSNKLCEILGVPFGKEFMADSEVCIIGDNGFDIICKGKKLSPAYKLSMLQSLINGEIDIEPIKKLTKEEVAFASMLYQYTNFRLVARTHNGTFLKMLDPARLAPTKVYCFNDYLAVGETASLLDLADMGEEEWEAEEEDDAF